MLLFSYRYVVVSLVQVLQSDDDAAKAVAMRGEDEERMETPPMMMGDMMQMDDADASPEYDEYEQDYYNEIMNDEVEYEE